MVDAEDYHERTKHSPRALRNSDFTLDERTRPRPYKVYADLRRESLDAESAPEAPALSVVAASEADPLAEPDGSQPEELDVETLSRLCFAASGVVQTVERDGRTVRFRTASCTGKLYHVDLYLVCGDLPGLASGIYHFDPVEFGLDVLRDGDYRSALATAAGGHDAVAAAPVTAVATSTWWRNAWFTRRSGGEITDVRGRLSAA